MVMSADDLFVLPKCVSFVSNGDRSAEKAFAALLAKHQAHTRRLDVTSSADAFMDASGLVRGKYRFSRPAFFDFARCIAPNAGSLIYNVATGYRAGLFASQEREVPDLALGMRIYNDLIKLRLAASRKRYQFIVDTDTNVIEGVVGTKYRLLFNAELYEKITDFVRSSSQKLLFREAVLEGRIMLLRYVTKKSVAKVQAGGREDVFYGGLNFTNSETGNVAIRASGLVAREAYGLTAISEAIGDARISHVRGVRFEKRLHFLLEAVQHSTIPGKLLQDRLQVLANAPLGLGGKKKSHDSLLKKWNFRLVKEGLHMHITREALAHMCLCGSGDTETATSREAFSKRTQYDLFNSVMHIAKNYGINWREQAERVAYRLLTGRFIVPNV